MVPGLGASGVQLAGSLVRTFSFSLDIDLPVPLTAGQGPTGWYSTSSTGMYGVNVGSVGGGTSGRSNCTLSPALSSCPVYPPTSFTVSPSPSPYAERNCEIFAEWARF